MKKVKDIVSRKALPAVLAVTMVIGNVLPVWADDTGNNNDSTGGGYTYAAPTEPMEVDPNIITATAHRAASPVIDMLGLNATAGTGMINGSAPSNLAEAMTKPALGVWGTSLNDSPDPYYWNYFYNFYADENGLAQSDDALRNSAQQASPAGADRNLLAEYGNISVSLSRRPDIAVGCSTGNDPIDTSGYDEQIATIRGFASDSDYYQEGDENYDPKLVAYQLYDLTTMVKTVKDIAAAAHAVEETTSKTWRYDDPMVIAGDYEKYIYGASAYVLSQIAAGKCEKKTVALINAINEDGTYTLSDSTSQSATSKTRIVEYTDLVTDNLADSLETPGTNGKIATKEQVAGADVIICLDNNNTQLTRDGIRESLGELYNGQMIITTTPSTLYGVTMNSVENAMGLGYIVGYMYSDVLPINPVEMCAYFYQRFYHISNMDNLKTVVMTNFANTMLGGMSALLADDYSAGKVESLLVQGMNYYADNPDAFAGTYIEEAGWDIDWDSGIGAGGRFQAVPQTISGVQDSYSKTYGDSAFSLGAVTDGDGAISYAVTSGSAVSVDASGKVTILSAGTAVITVMAAGTDRYMQAAKTVTIQVAKKGQTISGVSSSYSKKATAAAFNLGAKATGGTVTYSSNKQSVATVNASGKVTIKGAGTAKITITAPESTNYQKATKTVTIKVTKVAQTVKLGKSKASYKSSALKNKKQTFKIGAKAQGKITYKVTSGKKYISVNKNGKVTVKKGTPKGTYKVTVSAAATTKYKKAAAKTVKITVK